METKKDNISRQVFLVGKALAGHSSYPSLEKLVELFEKGGVVGLISFNDPMTQSRWLYLND